MVSRKIFALVVFAVIAAASIVLVGTFATTGFFYKAFDKTLSPGEQYERNITVKQFYNLTIRFQKETSTTTYLTFDNNDTIVVLKDASGVEVARGTGLINGKMYFLINKSTLDRIATVTATNLGQYEDVINQPANTTFSGTTAYITVKVTYRPASIFGTVKDQLTGTTVEGVTVAAFENGADPNTTANVNSSLTDSSGQYSMQFQLNSSKALDVYVKDYEVA